VKRRLGPKRAKGEYGPTALQEHLQDLAPAALRALLLDLAISRSAFYVAQDAKYSRYLHQAIDAYNVDASAIEKTVTEELSALRAARLSHAKAGSV
jgi:ParB family transcriptional regulator, chromosome partitioning protein